uniref:Chaperone protein DnaJ n=1 Tax=Anthurium amnicola TaxID=1678845 RepID=A0A1D1XMG8_9ARAE
MHDNSSDVGNRTGFPLNCSSPTYGPHLRHQCPGKAVIPATPRQKEDIFAQLFEQHFSLWHCIVWKESTKLQLYVLHLFLHLSVDAYHVSEEFPLSLGMCSRCGDLRVIACSRCRGVGMVRDGGLFGLGTLGDLYQKSGGGGGEPTMPCTKCQAKGRIRCPSCSKLP